MNEMIEKIITRHAIRRFADRQLEEETLREILTAGLYAPSAGNNQYSRIVVCQDKAVNLKLGQLSRYSSKAGTPGRLPTRSLPTSPASRTTSRLWTAFTAPRRC